MAVAAQIIPIQPVASQILNVTLNQQVCQINLYAKSIYIPITPPGSIPTDPPTYVSVTVMFLDLYLNDTLLIGGCLVRDGVGIVQNSYFGFVGEIAIEDTEGNSDPIISGLGTRFRLTYWFDQ